MGLLNIGGEEEKGNLACQAAYKLMKNSKNFNFVGNVEGRDLYKGKADVIVCDGFTGNIVLKQAEAMLLSITALQVTPSRDETAIPPALVFALFPKI